MKLKRQHFAIIAAAVFLPGGIFIAIAYIFRTKPWFREDLTENRHGHPQHPRQ